MCGNGMAVRVATGAQMTITTVNAQQAQGMLGMQVQLKAETGFGALSGDNGAAGCIEARLAMTFALLCGWAGFTRRQYDEFVLKTMVMILGADVTQNTRVLTFQCTESGLPA